MSDEPEQIEETTDTATDSTAQTADDLSRPGVAHRQAAKYRTRLRAVEAERDQATQQLEALRRQVIEQRSGLSRPEALWVSGVDPNTLFDEAGQLDTNQLQLVVSNAVETLGLATVPRTPAPDPTAGGHGGASAVRSWNNALNQFG